MCGLLGIAAHKNTRITPDLAGYLTTQLVFKNEQRGGDSFGLGLVTPDEKRVRTYKTVGKISQKGSYERSWAHGIGALITDMSAGKTTIGIGHNRKATTGANTVRNAHPFICGKPEREDFVIGAHNGVVAPWESIKKALEIRYDMEVDSEIIFRTMQKYASGVGGVADPNGDVKALRQLFPMAMISAVYMKDMKTLNLFRGDNPLAIAKGDGFVLWSSVDLHLRDTLLGLNVDIIDLAEGTLLQLDLDTFKTTELEIEPDWSLQRSLFPKKHTIHGRSPDNGGMGVVHGDRRSVYGGKKEEDSDFYRAIFRRHSVDPETLDDVGDDETDDALYQITAPSGAKVLPFPRLTEGNSQNVSLQKYIDTLVPKLYVTMPRDKTTKMECVSCAHQHEPKAAPQMFETWQLMWRGVDALCPVCHYYLVQADAEKEIAAIANRHHVD